MPRCVTNRKLPAGESLLRVQTDRRGDGRIHERLYRLRLASGAQTSGHTRWPVASAERRSVYRTGHPRDLGLPWRKINSPARPVGWATMAPYTLVIDEWDGICLTSILLPIRASVASTGPLTDAMFE